ncbi:hypothetical protein FRC08_004848 [Ceratobasidium sp. 394]|nr:hypothetical protein FRC08_004848 [Ceratobasidium sp. 394]KAG9094940.1 hypothetical protein FS749_011490 [Ceratobasidium sp. UAMH 11750]
MASREKLWGPGLDIYSQNFDPRKSTTSEKMATKFYKTEKVKIIGARLSEITKIFQRYTAMNKAKVFNHHYGFLCVRQMLHLFCLTIISNPDPDNSFYKTLGHTASYRAQTEAVARRVMWEVGEGFRGEWKTPTFVQMFSRLCQIWDESGKSTDLPLVIRKLWEDRDSFLILCARGLLPGFPLLLFASYTLAPKGDKGLLELCMQLKDLYARNYLVGSNRDRQVIVETCQSALSQCGQQDGQTINSFISSQDSRTISLAQVNLLLGFQRNLAYVEALSVDMAGCLSDLVLEVVGSDPSATAEELASTSHYALEYFWLLLARPKDISVEDQISIRWFVSRIFKFIRAVDARQSLGPDKELCLAQMFMKSDLISLIGRILFLTLNQETEAENTSRFWKTLFKSIIELKPILNNWVQAARELFYNLELDWAKLVELLMSIAINYTPQRRPQWHLVYVREMLMLMMDINSSFLNNNILGRHCAYSRCFPIPQDVVMIDARYCCEGCGRVTYCNPTECQLAHWNMETLESHKLECEAFHGQG